jgi:hypothetical protein
MSQNKTPQQTNTLTQADFESAIENYQIEITRLNSELDYQKSRTEYHLTKEIELGCQLHTTNLTNSVLKISDRALSVLTLLSCQFDNEDSNVCDHKVIHAVICGIMTDFEEVNAIVEAHCKAEYAKNQA